MAKGPQLVARCEPEIKTALEEIKATKGLLVEHQIRMGVLMWLESQGVTPLPKRKAKSRQ